MPTLRDRFRFMLENAGYSTPPGRAACALDMARAEERAEAEGITFTWEYDETPDTSWLDQEGWEKERRDYEQGRLEILGCTAVHPSLDRYEVSLWGISVYPDDRAYRRVVEAELASEALAIIDAAYAEEAGINRDAYAV